MRPSCYLNAVEIGDGSSLLYNGFSMCIDVVPSEIARRLAASGELSDISFLTPEEQDHLTRRGHLTRLSIEDEQEEMGKLARALAKREVEPNRQTLTGKMLTFILTYKCNLSCSYCFQNDVRDTSNLTSMSEPFVDEFLRNHLDQLFPAMPKNRLRFILFGGEPLLPQNRPVIERILRYAKEYGIVVSAATNAIMLPEMLDLIGSEDGKIQGVQVTLDGGQRFHDETRVTQSGAPTFEEIIHSIHHVIGAGAKVFVRIHLHPDRLESARALVEYLEQKNILGHYNVEIYFAPVHSFHAQKISVSDFDIFSGLFQYVALKQKKLPIQNFDYLEQIMDVETIKNWSRPRYCSVSTGQHYALDPLGDIYECLEEAGHKDRRIGAISGREIEYFQLREVYKKMCLANMPECLKCSIALFCGGGCISRKRTQGGSVFRQFCEQNKVFVGQTLKACFLKKQVAQSVAGT